MLFPVLIIWLLRLIRASKIDAIDLVIGIDDRHKTILLEAECTSLKVLKAIESEYRDLLGLIDIVEGSSESMCTYATNLCSIKGSTVSSSEELRTTVKPKIAATIGVLRGLISDLDIVEETRVLEANEMDYLVSLRDSIDLEVVKLEDRLLNAESLDRQIHKRLDALTLVVYGGLIPSLSIAHQDTATIQENLTSRLQIMPLSASYATISELSDQLHNYATAYKRYFSMFSAVLVLKQNFSENLPNDPIDFLPDLEQHFLDTLTTMNKKMRLACNLDQPLPVQKLRKATDIVQLKEEFWHFYHLRTENKSHLHNKDEYECLFKQYSEDKDIEVGLLEGNVMVKAVVFDAIVINPDGCYISKEHPLDQLVSHGILSTLCSLVPDTVAHPEWIEKLVPLANNQVTLNVKGLQELRKTIYNQFQVALNAGYHTIIVKQMGCAECKSGISQVAHVYAEAVKLFSKQGIQALYFVEEQLYCAVFDIVKAF
jgi:hypothetical protein